MGKLNVLKVTAILVAANMVAIGIGCGDGKTQRRQRTNRTIVGNKPNGGQPQRPQGGATTGGTTGGQTTPGGTQQGPGSNSNRDTLAKEEQIKTQVQQLSGGQAITAQQMDEGKYTLEEVASQFMHMQTTGRTETVYFFQDSVVQRSGNAVVLAKKGDQLLAGQPVNVDDQGGRKTIVPVEFTVQGQNGRPWTPARDLGANLVLVTRVELQGTNMSLVNKFEGGQNSVSELALLDILGQGADVMIGQGSSQQPGKQMKDPGGKDVFVRVIKVSETQVRVLISVDEQKATAQGTRNVGAQSRLIILTYKVEKTAPATQPAAPATGEPQGDAAPAQTGSLPVVTE